MTQPAVEATVEPTPEQQAEFEQYKAAFEQQAGQLMMAIGATLQHVLQGAEPGVASTALIRFAGGVASQVPHFTREIVTNELVTAFDKTREMMTSPPEGLLLALGLKPGDPLPADLGERIAKLAQQHGIGAPPQPAPAAVAGS